MAGKSADFPKSLFLTWLDYRAKKFDQSRADVIKEVNLKVDRSYDNTRFYQWLKFKHSVPDIVLLKCVYPDMPEMLRYVFERNNWPTKDIDFDILSETIRAPVKI